MYVSVSLLEGDTIAEVDRKWSMPPGRPWHPKASSGVTQVQGQGSMQDSGRRRLLVAQSEA